MARQPAEEQCWTCNAWVPIADRDDGLGMCRAHPPAVLFGGNVGQPGLGKPQAVFQFPLTYEVDWCREYQMEAPAP
jgi:hypothetical protein